MPSKQIYFYFFLGVVSVFSVAEFFVYYQLRRILRRDFPDWAFRAVPIIKWFFILMNIPIVFLFFRKEIKGDYPLLTTIMLYPFTIWQFLIIFWALILIPFTLLRLIRNRGGVTS
ncbi:MAG: hypothetical protein WCH46_09520 [bacterium]